MKIPSLFLLGLVVGALAVFGVRAMSLEDAPADDAPASTTPAAGDEAADLPADAHEQADHAPTSEGTSREPLADASADDRPPENAICPVMGNPIDPEVYLDHEGRRIGFCCPGCDAVFLEDPARYLAIVDQELARAEVLPPDAERAPENAICPVMGNPIDPEVYVDHEGRRIAFCCPGCDAVFLEDPERYLAIVDEELARRAAAAEGDEAPAEEADGSDDDVPEDEDAEADEHAGHGGSGR